MFLQDFFTKAKSSTALHSSHSVTAGLHCLWPATAPVGRRFGKRQLGTLGWCDEKRTQPGHLHFPQFLNLPLSWEPHEQYAARVSYPACKASSGQPLLSKGEGMWTNKKKEKKETNKQDGAHEPECKHVRKATYVQMTLL